eukprot:g16359.t1
MDWGFQHQHQGGDGQGGTRGCTDPSAQHPQQQRQQPRAVAGGGGGNINQSLDDAINRFGGMTLGSNSSTDIGCQIVGHRGGGAGGGMDGVGGLDMGALRVSEGGAGASFGYPNHQANGGVSRSQQYDQRQLGFPRPDAAAAAVAAVPAAPGAPAPAPASGCCSSCGGGGHQRRLPGGGSGTARRGPDGAWLDEEGRRLYTEVEVRAAVEHEGRAWRDKAASLERSLAIMESEAKAALERAEQTNAALAEQLRAAEGKTYALSVHLAQTNRPSHLA